MVLQEVLDNRDNQASLDLEEPLVVWVVLELQDNWDLKDLEVTKDLGAREELQAHQVLRDNQAHKVRQAHKDL
jgi:hypothetical protein